MALTERQYRGGLHPDAQPAARFKLLDALQHRPSSRRDVTIRIYGPKIGASTVASAVGWARTHRLIRERSGGILYLTDAGHLAVDFARLVGADHVFPAGSAGPLMELPLLPCEQDA